MVKYVAPRISISSLHLIHRREYNNTFKLKLQILNSQIFTQGGSLNSVSGEVDIFDDNDVDGVDILMMIRQKEKTFIHFLNSGQTNADPA